MTVPFQSDWSFEVFFNAYLANLNARNYLYESKPEVIELSPPQTSKAPSRALATFGTSRLSVSQFRTSDSDEVLANGMDTAQNGKEVSIMLYILGI